MKSRVTISFLSGIALFLPGCDTAKLGQSTSQEAASTGQSAASSDSESDYPETTVADGVTRKKPDGPIKPYPFDYCAVVGREFDGSRTYVRYYDGYEVKFCCVPCTRAFEASPEPWMAKIRAAHASSGSTTAKVHEEEPPSASPLPLSD